jgi:hypothetical protein
MYKSVCTSVHSGCIVSASIRYHFCSSLLSSIRDNCHRGTEARLLKHSLAIIMAKRDLFAESEAEVIVHPVAKFKAAPAVVTVVPITGNPNMDYGETSAYNKDPLKEARVVYKSFECAGEVDLPNKLEFLANCIGTYSIEQASCFHVSVSEDRVKQAKNAWMQDKSKVNWHVCKALGEIPGCYWRVHPACFPGNTSC